MSLSLHAVGPISPQRISYVKANEFIKLLDEERPVSELSRVLTPGTYYIGSGNGVIQWDGQSVYHAPPNGDIEVFDYMKRSGRDFNAGSSSRSNFAGFGRHGTESLAHEVASIQNGRSAGLQSSMERNSRVEASEMESPWSRGWAEAERQENLCR